VHQQQVAGAAFVQERGNRDQGIQGLPITALQAEVLAQGLFGQGGRQCRQQCRQRWCRGVSGQPEQAFSSRVAVDHLCLLHDQQGIGQCPRQCADVALVLAQLLLRLGAGSVLALPLPLVPGTQAHGQRSDPPNRLCSDNRRGQCRQAEQQPGPVLAIGWQGEKTKTAHDRRQWQTRPS